MKRKYILLVLIFIIFMILGISTKTYAADLDRIENYVVTVDPRMYDGSLDITYEITWRVIDSTTEGPLTWVQIGTPNEYFDTETALSSNIKSISKYNGSFVRIDFYKAYYAGEEVTFKYSIHQPYIYTVSWGNCKYKFTPAWFTNARVDNLTIRWNKDEVKKSDTKKTEDNYLVWNKTDMSKGEKLTINVKYDKSAFSSLTSAKKTDFGSSFTVIFIILFIVCIFSSIFGGFGGGGYYRHRGFYGGGYYGGFRGGCVHSSCACAHSSCASSCACACAGSGRAGCSRKDFYGTNLNSKKIKEAMK